MNIISFILIPKINEVGQSYWEARTAGSPAVGDSADPIEALILLCGKLRSAGSGEFTPPPVSFTVEIESFPRAGTTGRVSLEAGGRFMGVTKWVSTQGNVIAAKIHSDQAVLTPDAARLRAKLLLLAAQVAADLDSLVKTQADLENIEVVDGIVKLRGDRAHE